MSEKLFGIRDDSKPDRVIAADLVFVDIDLDQLGRRNVVDVAWNPGTGVQVVEVRPNRQDDVSVATGFGRGIIAPDAVNFLNQYQQAAGETPFISGSITVDQTILSQEGSAKQALIGTPPAGPQADSWDDLSWQAFVNLYQGTFEEDERFPSPSLFATTYYTATKAMIEALNAVDGDLSDGQAAFRETLTTLELVAPTGTVTLGKNRNGIVNNFLTEVVEGEDGYLQNQLIKVIPSVNQTLGFPHEDFLALGAVGRDVPSCN